MRLMTLFLFIIIFSAGLLCEPVFVLAGDTCYVDEDADDDGDGSDDESYQDIEEALYKDCDKIIIEKGIYKDDITIGRDVEVEGKNRNDVIIVGKVTMKDGSELKRLTVTDSGIDVADGASVKIDDLKIKDANIGIETTGNGTLTVKNSILYENRKAMYLQQGKNVKITNSEVYDNDEEGIDIRANVDGTISDNSIHNNGESGIEVIVGKSDLKIYDNKIKKNGASGIAAQYYKEASKLGGVIIKDNTITGNKDYGINCKAPSGGNPGVEYWTKSMEMLANKVYDNKDGDFSEACYFDEQKIDDATKTKKQQDQEKVVQIAKVEAQQQQVQEQEIKTEKERLEKEEQEKKEAQEQLRNKLQKEKNLQRDVENILVEVQELYNIDTISKEKIKSRPKFFMFFIGPDYGELKNIANNITVYKEKIERANNIKNEVIDGEILKRININIEEMNQKQKNIFDVAVEYNDTFSLFGWVFKKNI